jgi:hypothetical protein
VKKICVLIYLYLFFGSGWKTGKELLIVFIERTYSPEKKMKKLILLTLLIVFSVKVNAAEFKFRSGVFLHHSTGARIWGSSQGMTSVPEEIDSYNFAHGYFHGLMNGTDGTIFLQMMILTRISLLI